MIEPAMEEAMGREVSVGAFEAKLLRSFPDLSVGIKELAIHTPPNGADERPDLARFDAAWIDLSILPLLQSRVHLNAVHLESPLVLVEVYEDLSSNLLELTARREGTSSEESAVREIAVEQFTITNGQLAYSHADGTLFTVSDLNADLSATLRALASVSGTISASDLYFETGGLPYAGGWDVAVDLVAQANLDSSWVELQQVQAGVESLLFSVSGKIADWDSDAIDIDLVLDAPEARIEGLWSLLPAALIKDVEGINGQGQVDIAATIKGILSEDVLPVLDAKVGVKQASIQYPALPSPIQDLNMDADISFESLQINQLSASAAGGTIDLNGAIQNFASPQIAGDLRINADLSKIKEYYPLDAGTTLSGDMAIDVSLRGALAAPEDLVAEGVASLSGIDYSSTSLEQPVEALSGRLRFDGSALQTEDVSFKTGRSDLQFAGTLDRYLSLLSDSVIAGQEASLNGHIKSTLFDASEQLPEDTTSTEPLILPAIIADLTFDAETLHYDGIDLSNTDGQIRMQNGVITFEGGSRGFLDGILRTSGTFNVADPYQPTFEGVVGLDRVRASRFFTAFERLNDISRLGGFLDGFFDSEASIALQMDEGLNPLMESLLAEGTFGATGGVLKDTPLQEQLAGLTGVSALAALDVGQWTHQFSISGEKLHVQALTMNAGDFAFGLNGAQGFDGTIDYLVRVELPESASAALSNAPVQGAIKPVSSVANVALVDPVTRRITLDFLAKGSFMNPDVKLDTEMFRSRLNARASALAADARADAQARIDSVENAARLKAEAELAEQKQILEDKAKEEASKLLEGLVDSTAITADLDSLKEKGGEVLKNRLKGLLGRKKKN